MPTMTYINDDGDKILVEVPSAIAKAFEEQGYREATSEDLGTSLSNAEVTRAAITAAGVLSEAEALESGSSPNARSQDPEEAPADPFGVAYPSGQIPYDAGAVGATGTLIEPLDDRLKAMEEDPDSPNPGEADGSSARARPAEQPNTGPEGTSYLIHSYATPPNKDEIESAMKASKTDPSVPIDPRGVIDRTPGSAPDPAEPMSLENMPVEKELPEGEEASSGGPVSTTVPNAVETPDDLKASSVVKETQGAKGGDGKTSQGSSRPAADTKIRSKN